MAVLEQPRRRKGVPGYPVNGQRLLIDNVPWKAYQQLGRLLNERNLHVTFDRGRLEIMPLSMEHERRKCVLRMIVDVLAEERNLAIKSFGSMTQQREDLDRGLEPDQCYYLQGLKSLGRRKRLDLSRDPPPDLVLEIDVTSSSLDRLSIYAALGVREVWRLHEEGLEFLILENGGYRSGTASLSFPGIQPDELYPLVALGQRLDDVAFRRRVRNWLKSKDDD